MKNGGRDISWKSGTAEKGLFVDAGKKMLLKTKTNIENKNASLVTIKFICVNIIYNSDFTDTNILIGYSLILGAS